MHYTLAVGSLAESRSLSLDISWGWVAPFSESRCKSCSMSLILRNGRIVFDVARLHFVRRFAALASWL